MPKSKACKYCGSESHLSLSCFKKPMTFTGGIVIKSNLQDSAVIKPRKKKSPKNSAKDKAWKAFSDYIRLRDSLATTGTAGYCICITCNERDDSSWKLYKTIQAGHSVGGRSNAILFHEEIVNGQCGYCNRKPPLGLGGDYGNYAIALIKRYGLKHVEYLQSLKSVTLQYKTADYLQIEQRYKEKLADLMP